MEYELNHLAIIMDGNGRWAKENNKTIEEGHAKGAKIAKSLIPFLSESKIKYLTLYAFSSENWQRPQSEISSLVNILSNYALKEVSELNKYNIKLKIIGDLEPLSQTLRDKISDSVKQTADNTGPTLCIAFSYGGRGEIINAVNNIVQNNSSKDYKITEAEFSRFLYDPEMPDVDMMIRTSGVARISNFLIWQSAYAELYFIDKYWPDFTIEDLEKSIEFYYAQLRNFGKRREYK